MRQMLHQSNWKKTWYANAWTQTCHKKTWSFLTNILLWRSRTVYIQSGDGLHCGPGEQRAFKSFWRLGTHRLIPSTYMLNWNKYTIYQSAIFKCIGWWQILEFEEDGDTSRSLYPTPLSVKGRLITILLGSVTWPKLVTLLKLVAALYIASSRSRSLPNCKAGQG